MRWAFWRKPGKHDLGAAVTGIPSMPVARVVPASRGVAQPVVVESTVPSLDPGPAPLGPPVPRIELGFRDGSTAALAPGSPQALALTEIAAVLAKRD